MGNLSKHQHLAEESGVWRGVLLISGCFGCDRLQEVNAAPVRFISDMLAEDSWSHVFMDTLAPRGFVKVRMAPAAMAPIT